MQGPFGDARRNDHPQIPTRMDWLHWVQSLDPQNAKASDVELGHLGLTVLIKNPIALEFLKKTALDANGFCITLKFPNRRMGIDLNRHHENDLLDYDYR